MRMYIYIYIYRGIYGPSFPHSLLTNSKLRTLTIRVGIVPHSILLRYLYTMRAPSKAVF